MLYAVLGDTHFGCRNDNKRIAKSQIEFFEEQFFPYLKKNGIKHIIQTGDFYDNRKWISMSCLADSIQYFVNKTIELGIEVHIIAGNHDLPYKLNNKHSSVGQILSVYNNINVYENECKKVGNVTFVPWISKDNEDSINSVLEVGGDICVGHFETTSFLMEKNQTCKHGTTNLDSFKGWDLVLSGHFHRRSKKKNVVYVGVPYEMSFHDADQTKGFHILDTETKDLKFIKNKNKVFNIINFNSSEDDIPNISKMEDSFIKLLILDNNDPNKTNKLIKAIEDINPFDFKIVDKSSFESGELDLVEEINEENLKTETVIEEYVKMMCEDHTLKSKILSKTLSIYKEAKELQDSMKK